LRAINYSNHSVRDKPISLAPVGRPTIAAIKQYSDISIDVSTIILYHLGRRRAFECDETTAGRARVQKKMAEYQLARCLGS
jgi:hypothetical protein